MNLERGGVPIWKGICRLVRKSRIYQKGQDPILLGIAKVELGTILSPTCIDIPFMCILPQISNSHCSYSLGFWDSKTKNQKPSQREREREPVGLCFPPVLPFSGTVKSFCLSSSSGSFFQVLLSHLLVVAVSACVTCSLFFFSFFFLPHNFFQ